MRAAVCALVIVCAMPAHADEARLRRAHKEKIVGIALSVIGLAISMTGGAFAIANHGFSRDTHEERVFFGLSVGLAAGAAPIVTSGVTLWARGAVIEQREKRRVALAPAVVEPAAPPPPPATTSPHIEVVVSPSEVSLTPSVDERRPLAQRWLLPLYMLQLRLRIDNLTDDEVTVWVVRDVRTTDVTCNDAVIPWRARPEVEYTKLPKPVVLAPHQIGQLIVPGDHTALIRVDPDNTRHCELAFVVDGRTQRGETFTATSNVVKIHFDDAIPIPAR